MRVIGALILIGLGLLFVSNQFQTPWLPVLIYILLMQLRPVQDVAYPILAARLATSGASIAQGFLILGAAFGAVVGILGAGYVAEEIGWIWVPAVMAIMCGLAFILGLRARKFQTLLDDKNSV
jgi:hypothetical protein